MHEARLVRELVAKVDTVARANHVHRVEGVRIEIGALSHVTPESLNGQFELLSLGSASAGAHLDINKATDATDPYAHDIRLVSVTVSEA